MELKDHDLKRIQLYFKKTKNKMKTIAYMKDRLKISFSLAIKLFNSEVKEYA